MRKGALFPAFAVVLAAGCGGPTRFDFLEVETADQRFHAPSAPDGKAAADAILQREELTLDDVLRIADLLNPALAVERNNIDLATAAIWDAQLYPNPTLGIEIEEYKTGGGSLRESKRVGSLTLPVVLNGRIGKAAAAAEKDRTVEALNYVWRRREILNDVKHSFVHLLAARRAEELSRETRDIAKSLQELTDERFRARAIPEMETLKTAVNLATAETKLRRAESDAVIAVKTIHALMGDVDFPNDRFAGTLAARFSVPSLDALRGQVVASHPLAEAAKAALEAAELQLSAAKATAIPDFDVVLAAGKGIEDDTILEGGISIPLPLFHRNQGAILAAEIRLRQAELRIQAVRNDLLLKLTEAYRTFTTAQECVRVYQEEILPKSQKALDQTHDGYKLGKYGYLDVLDAQRTLAESRGSYTSALEDLNLAAANLEKLTGTRLEVLR